MIIIGKTYNFTLNGNHLCRVQAMEIVSPACRDVLVDGEILRPGVVLCRREDNAATVIALEHELKEARI
jgi:hypothetical protein